MVLSRAFIVVLVLAPNGADHIININRHITAPESVWYNPTHYRVWRS